MMDVIVKIMVEVLSILGIATKEIGQGSVGMSLPVHIVFKKSTFMQKSTSRG